jgi:hypothetical protein
VAIFCSRWKENRPGEAETPASLIEKQIHNTLIVLQLLLGKKYSNHIRIGTFIAKKTPEG